MTTTIRETIENALPTVADSYPEYVDTVVSALEEREYQIVENLTEKALDIDINYELVEETFTNSGLSIRPKPEPEIEYTEDSEVVITVTDDVPEWAKALINMVGSVSDRLAKLEARN